VTITVAVKLKQKLKFRSQGDKTQATHGDSKSMSKLMGHRELLCNIVVSELSIDKQINVDSVHPKPESHI